MFCPVLTAVLHMLVVFTLQSLAALHGSHRLLSLHEMRTIGQVNESYQIP